LLHSFASKNIFDVILPALHEEAITFREEIYANARQLKSKSYPRKDSNRRLLNESICLPFILTSIRGWGLCDEGHDFIRLCKKRNQGPMSNFAFARRSCQATCEMDSQANSERPFWGNPL